MGGRAARPERASADASSGIDQRQVATAWSEEERLPRIAVTSGIGRRISFCVAVAIVHDGIAVGISRSSGGDRGGNGFPTVQILGARPSAEHALPAGVGWHMRGGDGPRFRQRGGGIRLGRLLVVAAAAAAVLLILSLDIIPRHILWSGLVDDSGPASR